MNEANLGNGRYLVSVNMGAGFEEFNDPQAALRQMNNFYELMAESAHRNLARSNRGLESRNEDFLAEYATLDFEMHWLRGDTEWLKRYRKFLEECDVQERGQI